MTIINERTPKAVPYLLMLLLAFVAFGPTLKVGFMWDDHEMIERNPAIQSVTASNIARAFKGDVFDGKGDAYFRPLQTLFNMADYAMWGGRPIGFHITNFLLHVGACWFLFLCLWKALGDPTIALIPALFSAVHPIIVEQLLIIAGRAELMAALFTYAALLAAMRRTSAGYAASLLFFALACLSKESGIAMPLFLILIGWFNKDLRAPLKNYAGYAVVAAIYFYLRAKAVDAPSLSNSVSAFLLFVIRDLPTIFISYLRVLLLPFDLHSHRRMVFHMPWLYLSPVLLIGFLSICAWKRWRAGFFAAGWFVLGLAPKIPLLATNSLMLDHWAYVAAVGLFILIAILIRAWFETPRTANAGAAMFVLLVGFWAGMARWSIAQRDTDFKMYTWALRYPTSSIVRYNLGLIYYQSGEYSTALRLFDDALKINPDQITSLNGKALCLWKMGRPGEGAAVLTDAIARAPGTLSFYVNRAVIVGGQKALDDLDFVLARKPDYGFALQLREELLKKTR